MNNLTSSKLVSETPKLDIPRVLWFLSRSLNKFSNFLSSDSSSGSWKTSSVLVSSIIRASLMCLFMKAVRRSMEKPDDNKIIKIFIIFIYLRPKMNLI